jgi:hypothetical protein
VHTLVLIVGVAMKPWMIALCLLALVCLSGTTSLEDASFESVPGELWKHELVSKSFVICHCLIAGSGG